MNGIISFLKKNKSTKKLLCLETTSNKKAHTLLMGYGLLNDFDDPTYHLLKVSVIELASIHLYCVLAFSPTDLILHDTHLLTSICRTTPSQRGRTSSLTSDNP